MNIRINPAIQHRILQCAECGNWVEDEGATGSDSFRGFGAAAVKHLSTEHPDAYAEYMRSPGDVDLPFYIYTERRFEMVGE